MFDLTFNSPVSEIANIAEFKSDIMQSLFNQRVYKEKYNIIGNTTYETVIVAVMLLMVIIRQDIERGSTKTYDDFSELYNFPQIEKSLNIQQLSLNDFFEYFNLFNS